MEIEVSDRMAAWLVGINFEKEPEDARVLVLGSAEPATWSWQVIPEKSGPQELLLVITARISVQGHDTDLVVASSRQDIVVTNPLSRRISKFIGVNWEWLWVVVFAPLAGGAWRWYKKRNDRSAGNDREDAG